jgi:hypothetical protein
MVRAVTPWKRPDPFSALRGDRSIDVRKAIAAARRFPFERRLKRLLIEGDEDEIGFTVKVPSRRLAQLMAGGEMNETIATVIGRAQVDSSRGRLMPVAGAADLVNQSHFSPQTKSTLSAMIGLDNDGI